MNSLGAKPVTLLRSPTVHRPIKMQHRLPKARIAEVFAPYWSEPRRHRHDGEKEHGSPFGFPVAVDLILGRQASECCLRTNRRAFSEQAK